MSHFLVFQKLAVFATLPKLLTCIRGNNYASTKSMHFSQDQQYTSEDLKCLDECCNRRINLC